MTAGGTFAPDEYGFQKPTNISFDGIDGRIAEPLADLVAALKQHIE